MIKSKRVLLFDIESSNLAANFGYTLCICYKWLGEKTVHTISIDQFDLYKVDPTNDKNVVKEFKKIYEQADMVVAHYGQKFDRTFVNTRLLVHSLSALPSTKLFDTWRVAKDHLRLNSNRLATLISALGIKYKKTELDGPTWIKAMAGNKSALKYVIQHCIMDTLALEQVYLKLQPLVLDQVNPIVHQCDPKFSVKFGYKTCLKKVYHRMQCRKCGGFWTGEIVK